MTENGAIKESLPGTIDQMELFFTLQSRKAGHEQVYVSAGGSSPLGDGCYLHRTNGTVHLCGPRTEVERQADNYLHFVVGSESNSNASRQ
jgi:hypothetical protein